MKNAPLVLSKTYNFGVLTVENSFLPKVNPLRLILSGIVSNMDSNSKTIEVLVKELLFLDALATTASSSDIEITSTMFSVRPDTGD